MYLYTILNISAALRCDYRWIVLLEWLEIIQTVVCLLSVIKTVNLLNSSVCTAPEWHTPRKAKLIEIYQNARRVRDQCSETCRTLTDLFEMFVCLFVVFLGCFFYFERVPVQTEDRKHTDVNKRWASCHVSQQTPRVSKPSSHHVKFTARYFNTQ